MQHPCDWKQSWHTFRFFSSGWNFVDALTEALERFRREFGERSDLRFRENVARIASCSLKRFVMVFILKLYV